MTDNARNQNLIWEIRANIKQFHSWESDIHRYRSPSLWFNLLERLYFYLKFLPSSALSKSCERERCEGQWSLLTITTEGRDIHPHIRCTDAGIRWRFRMDGPAVLISNPIPARHSPPHFHPPAVSLISIVLVRQKQHLIMENAAVSSARWRWQWRWGTLMTCECVNPGVSRFKQTVILKSWPTSVLSLLPPPVPPNHHPNIIPTSC